MDIGAKIKNAREVKGFTQEELGQRCHTTKQTIFKYENGLVTNIPMDKLKKIALALDVSPAYLMGWENDEGATDLGLSAIDIAKWIDADPVEVCNVIEAMPISNGIDSEALAKIVAEVQSKKAPSKKDEADEIAERYRLLDAHGRGAVKAILDFEHSSYVAETRQFPALRRADLKSKKRSDGFIEIKVYDQPAAAGLGNYLDDPSFHIEQYPASVIPDGADFGIKISGDSMSPDIRDGSTVFVQSRTRIEPGKIGIFLLNEEAYCKKLVVDKERNQVHLVSLNSAYKDRIIEDCDVFQTMGLVLGCWSSN